MIKRLGIIFLLLFINGCSHKDKNSMNGENEIVTVTLKPLVTNLMYAGTVQPLKAVVVTTPAEGVSLRRCSQSPTTLICD